MWETIAAWGRALFVGLGLIQDRSKLNNSPEVQQGAKNVEAAKLEDKLTKDVANKNLQETRKDISLLLVASLILFSACSTVIPKQAAPKVPSFDGSSQNSGLLEFGADGRGLLSSSARDRYNALVDLYGNRFVVPLVRDAGIVAAAFVDGTGPTYWIDQEHLVKFGMMANWHRNQGTVK